MDPIIPREPRKAKAPKLSPAFAGLSQVDTLIPAGWHIFAMVTAGLASLSAFAASVYFFIGFAQTDSGGLSLLSAGALCFGVGALAFGPTALVAYWAGRARRGDWRASRFWLSLCLLAPWLLVSALAVFRTSFLAGTGGFVFAVTALIMQWPIRNLGALQTRRKVRRVSGP